MKPSSILEDIALLKAQVKGYYRTDKKTGTRVWVRPHGRKGEKRIEAEPGARTRTAKPEPTHVPRRGATLTIGSAVAGLSSEMAKVASAGMEKLKVRGWDDNEAQAMKYLSTLKPEAIEQLIIDNHEDFIHRDRFMNDEKGIAAPKTSDVEKKRAAVIADAIRRGRSEDLGTAPTSLEAIKWGDALEAYTSPMGMEHLIERLFGAAGKSIARYFGATTYGMILGGLAVADGNMTIDEYREKYTAALIKKVQYYDEKSPALAKRYVEANKELVAKVLASGVVVGKLVAEYRDSEFARKLTSHVSGATVFRGTGGDGSETEYFKGVKVGDVVELGARSFTTQKRVGKDFRRHREPILLKVKLKNAEKCIPLGYTGFDFDNEAEILVAGKFKVVGIKSEPYTPPNKNTPKSKAREITLEEV